jgi:hypothetical protein
MGNSDIANCVSTGGLGYELELPSLLARLSLVFDQPSDWIGFDIAPDERDRTMQTLQLAGILGVCDNIEAMVCEPVVLGLSPDQVAPSRSPFAFEMQQVKSPWCLFLSFRSSVQ